MNPHRSNPPPHSAPSGVLANREGLSPRFALRAATAEAHERLDRLFAAFDLGRSTDYAAFLLAQTPALIGVEDALDKARAERVIKGWASRRRSAALLHDLAALGLPEPPPLVVPPFSTDEEILGAAYVLEGSRLGGAMLIRTVAPGLPTAFLSPGNSADWRTFVTLLDERLGFEASLVDATSAALFVFALFEQSAHLQLGADRP